MNEIWRLAPPSFLLKRKSKIMMGVNRNSLHCSLDPEHKRESMDKYLGPPQT
jgi:hypothetical protein